MGTKNAPAPFDCYANALPDEPMFVLLARDPHAPALVRLWAALRRVDIEAGVRPASDLPMVEEAYGNACDMAEWRHDNDGKWRRPAEEK